MKPTNIALLTRSHNAVAFKRRAKSHQIKEVVFDDDARREFLTGFHKRKLAKREASRAKASEREKQTRLQNRREQRRMLAERAAENAAHVEKAYGATTDEGADEWEGIQESSENGKTLEEEYEDEEHLATVTVVEDFDPHTIIHGPPKIPPSSITSVYQSPKPRIRDRSHTDALKINTKGNTMAKKIRYETKSARKAEKHRQKARRTEKAEKAGGKGARSKTWGKGR